MLTVLLQLLLSLPLALALPCLSLGSGARRLQCHCTRCQLCPVLHPASLLPCLLPAWLISLISFTCLSCIIDDCIPSLAFAFRNCLPTTRVGGSAARPVADKSHFVRPAPRDGDRASSAHMARALAQPFPVQKGQSGLGSCMVSDGRGLSTAGHSLHLNGIRCSMTERSLVAHEEAARWGEGSKGGGGGGHGQHWELARPASSSVASLAGQGWGGESVASLVG